MSDRETCPQIVVDAGAAMQTVRCLAEHLEQLVPWARAKVYAAAGYMVEHHGAYRMEAGELLAALADAEGAHARLMAAHARTAEVLDKYEVARPTADQLRAAMAADPGPALNEGGR